MVICYKIVHLTSLFSSLSLQSFFKTLTTCRFHISIRDSKHPALLTINWARISKHDTAHGNCSFGNAQESGEFLVVTWLLWLCSRVFYSQQCNSQTRTVFFSFFNSRTSLCFCLRLYILIFLFSIIGVSSFSFF
jgi:hypothetical protein